MKFKVVRNLHFEEMELKYEKRKMLILFDNLRFAIKSLTSFTYTN